MVYPDLEEGGAKIALGCVDVEGHKSSELRGNTGSIENNGNNLGENNRPPTATGGGKRLKTSKPRTEAFG